MSTILSDVEKFVMKHISVASRFISEAPPTIPTTRIISSSSSSSPSFFSSTLSRGIESRNYFGQTELVCQRSPITEKYLDKKTIGVGSTGETRYLQYLSKTEAMRMESDLAKLGAPPCKLRPQFTKFSLQIKRIPRSADEQQLCEDLFTQLHKTGCVNVRVVTFDNGKKTAYAGFNKYQGLNAANSTTLFFAKQKLVTFTTGTTRPGRSPLRSGPKSATTTPTVASPKATPGATSTSSLSQTQPTITTQVAVTSSSTNSKKATISKPTTKETSTEPMDMSDSSEKTPSTT
jgi:hypothetical protein